MLIVGLQHQDGRLLELVLIIREKGIGYLRHVIGTDARRQLHEQDIFLTKHATLKGLVLDGLVISTRTKKHVIVKKADNDCVAVLVEILHRLQIAEMQNSIRSTIRNKVEKISIGNARYHQGPGVLLSVETIILPIDKHSELGERRDFETIFPLLIVSQFHLNRLEGVVALHRNVAHQTPGGSKVLAVATPLPCQSGNQRQPKHTNERGREGDSSQIRPPFPSRYSEHSGPTLPRKEPTPSENSKGNNSGEKSEYQQASLHFLRDRCSEVFLEVRPQEVKCTHHWNPWAPRHAQRAISRQQGDAQR